MNRERAQSVAIASFLAVIILTGLLYAMLDRPTTMLENKIDNASDSEESQTGKTWVTTALDASLFFALVVGAGGLIATGVFQRRGS